MATKTKYDYEEIFLTGTDTRPGMSHPTPMQASRKLLQIIEDAQREHDTPEAFADWFANYLEGFGASTAEAVFTMDGAGPVCSWCGNIWPLCGHHHMSDVEYDEEDNS